MTIPRTIEQLVEEQGLRWSRRPMDVPLVVRPAIAISRLPGAGGDEVAQRLCDRLHYRLLDREIVHRIATSARLTDQVVDSLDEKSRSTLAEWIQGLVGAQRLSPYGYLYHLTRLIGALAHSGEVVIVGRGGHLILGPSQALRVLVVAPLTHRLHAVALAQGVGEDEARRRVEEEEAERRAFLRQYFHAELADASQFDLVVNTHALGVDGAVAIVEAALHALSRP